MTVDERSVIDALARLSRMYYLRKLEEIYAALEAMAEHPLLEPFPFRMDNVKFVDQKFPVLSSLLFQREDKPYRKVFETLEDYTCLCVDLYMPIGQGLFVVRKFESDNAEEAMEYMQNIAQAGNSKPYPVVFGMDRADCPLVAFQLAQAFAPGRLS